MHIILKKNIYIVFLNYMMLYCVFIYLYSFFNVTLLEIKLNYAFGEEKWNKKTRKQLTC